MSFETAGLVIGGLLPALLFGLSNVIQKGSAGGGIGIGPYLLSIGAGVITVGIVVGWLVPERTATLRSAALAWCVGILWSAATALIAIAITRFSAPLSKLVPIYNTNTLIAVALALVVFSEWRDLSVSRLLLGACLIMAGSFLVIRS